MLYKKNILTKPLPCNDKVMTDITSMRFGKLSDDVLVFDATFYCSQELHSQFQDKQFMMACRQWIDAIANDSKISISELFYVNTDGHVLLHKDLAVIFLMWADTNMLVYFMSLIEDALIDGIVLSDGLLLSMIIAKVPDKVLEGVLEGRKNENDGKEHRR